VPLRNTPRLGATCAALGVCLALLSACRASAPPDEGAPALGTCPSEWTRPFPVDPEEYPFTSRCLELGHGLVHYIDERPATGEPKGTVLQIHGNPMWSFMYRKTTRELVRRGYRVLALDLYGFGMSAKPPLEQFDYRASSHSETVARFVEKLDLHHLLLVVNDWGGPVGLGMAVRMPERIDALLLTNTWSWEVEPPASGNTGYMHVVHDWSVENIRNPSKYAETGEIPIRALRGVARINGAVQGSELYTKLRDATLGPYIRLEEPYTALLAPGVARPTHVFARSLLEDAVFLRELDTGMSALYGKPVYLMFGDDTAFGPRKCDPGLYESRPACSEGLVCSVSTPRPYNGNCLGTDGKAPWPYVEHYLSRWRADQVVGVWTDASHGQLLPEEVPELMVEAVEKLSTSAQ